MGQTQDFALGNYFTLEHNPITYNKKRSLSKKSNRAASTRRGSKASNSSMKMAYNINNNSIM